MKTYYLHTLDGKSAYFDGDQIVFCMFYGRKQPLAESLKQIRSEQRKSKDWRAKRGYPEYWKISYVKVNVPD